MSKQKIREWLDKYLPEITVVHKDLVIGLIHQYTQEQSGWVRVDERLPEEDAHVVAAHLYKYLSEPDAAVCVFFDGKFHLHDDGLEIESSSGGYISMDIDVTHWMPLPLTPTEEA